MHTDLTTLTVAQYAQYIAQKEYLVDRRYQRTPKVWTRPAQSALIETILLDYPIPKLALHQVTDIPRRRTIHYIVDGQQRTQAIVEYYNDQFPLSRNVQIDSAKGRRFSQLDEDLQAQFLNYSIQFDLFVGVEDAQIREVFTVPLNDEEQRYAEFQGPFKWFINTESRQYTQILLDSGVLRERAVNRMAEDKLFTEICHAWTHGIQTTNRRALDGLYRQFDSEFPHEEQYSDRFNRFFDWFRETQELWRTSLCRPFAFYSLTLAHSHVTERISSLQDVFPVHRSRNPAENAVQSLSSLAEIMDLSRPPDDERLAAFWRACDSQTNVKSTRQTRFVTMCNALVEG